MNTSAKSLIPWILTTVVFILFSLFAGCHNPFVARYARSKIKIGMMAHEVYNIIEETKPRLIYCDTEQEQAMTGNECLSYLSSGLFPSNPQKVEMKVIYMGPVYVKNEFHIIFGLDGKVEGKTRVKSWD